MDFWDQMVDCICRPPRDTYSPEQLLGSPAGSKFPIGPVLVQRSDFELTNKRGAKLQCSHYAPVATQHGPLKGRDGKLPVVVYCHCNSGSRRDAEEAVGHLLPMGIGVVAFDFMGSGLSDGQWVTLGYTEAEDLGVVVEWLRARDDISAVGLWGRSMGAVTALLYASKDAAISGMVLDSPFSRLTDLMSEIVKDTGLPIPKPLVRVVSSLMRRSVKRKAGFDICDVAPLDAVGGSVVPAVFGHATGDSFINVSHSEKLVAAYGGEYKNLVRFGGDHNHFRPKFFYDSVTMFFHQQAGGRFGFKMDERLPGHTDYLMQYEELLGAARGRLDPSALMRYESRDLARANGGVNQPWHIGLSSQDMGSLSDGDLARLLASAGGALAGAGAAAARASPEGAGGAGPAAAAAGGAALDPAAQLRAALGGGGGGGDAAAAAADPAELEQERAAAAAAVARQLLEMQAAYYDDPLELEAALLASLEDARLQAGLGSSSGAGSSGGGGGSQPSLPLPAPAGESVSPAPAAAGPAAGSPPGRSGGAAGSGGKERAKKGPAVARGFGGKEGVTNVGGFSLRRARALFGGAAAAGPSKPAEPHAAAAAAAPAAAPAPPALAAAQNGAPRPSAGGPAAAAVAAAAAVGTGAANAAWRDELPSTEEEAEALLQQALALSLGESGAQPATAAAAPARPEE